VEHFSGTQVGFYVFLSNNRLDRNVFPETNGLAYSSGPSATVYDGGAPLRQLEQTFVVKRLCQIVFRLQFCPGRLQKRVRSPIS